MKYYVECQKVDLFETLCLLIDLLNPKYTKDKVLIIPIGYSATAYKKNKEFFHRFNIKIVSYSPGNYRFIGILKEKKPNPIISEVKRYSYHDSCWRSDGIENIVHKYAKELTNRIGDSELHWNINIQIAPLFNPIEIIDGKIIDIDNEDFSKLERTEVL